MVVEPRSGKAVDALRKRLARHSAVAYAEPDFYQTKSIEPNDPLYPPDTRWWTVSADHDIDAPEAWDVEQRAARRSPCSTPARRPTTPTSKATLDKSADKPNNNKDDDKNGYVDDYYGVEPGRGQGLGRGRRRSRHPRRRDHRGAANNDIGVSGLCWSGRSCR